MFDERSLLIVGEKMNYMMLSLQDNLRKCAIDIETVSPDIESVSRVATPFNGLLIYTNMAIATDKTLLVYIKDLVNEKSLPLFLIGDIMELDEIKKVIPEHIIRMEFHRPINIKEVCVQVSDSLDASATLQKKNILLVDDSPIILHNLTGWLEDKYNVETANSGITAIRSMFMNKPDLVLLDYEMPVANGKQVLEMIRNEPELSDIPVMFLTSHGDKEYVLEVMSLRPSGYLLKSMKPVDIVRAINDFFLKQKSRI